MPPVELKPIMQLHMKLPRVLTQSETVELQLTEPKAHSSISTKKKVSQSHIYVDQSYFDLILPLHDIPSPEYPVLHEHTKLPSVSRQSAFMSHTLEPVLHSSISNEEK